MVILSSLPILSKFLSNLQHYCSACTRLCVPACLPVHLVICVSVVSVCPSVYLPVCLPACLSVCLSVCISVGRFVCLCLSVHPSVSVCLSICLSVSVGRFVCLSVSQSVCLFICQFYASIKCFRNKGPCKRTQQVTVLLGPKMLGVVGICCVVHANERNDCQHCWRKVVMILALITALFVPSFSSICL